MLYTTIYVFQQKKKAGFGVLIEGAVEWVGIEV